ncbi:hypothetical protein OPIT5_10680 [Opitutaceae bacterium TAV5]|nr:hypothetical protein OPIT5_10680 [Opitutaceae bacterium TAV5]
MIEVKGGLAGPVAGARDARRAGTGGERDHRYSIFPQVPADNADGGGENICRGGECGMGILPMMPT